ncbi:uridine kinase [Mangrovihabitans endophyticus]|nr:uridine kinase [Mangrovihabitans endophyticus]
MRVRPVSFAALVDELADRFAGQQPGRRLRVAVDGPPPAAPGLLADALVDPLRVRGRAAVRVSAGDFLRPASVRLEFGRTDPDAFYHGWFDEAALRREVLEPAGPGGTGTIVTTLWDPETDRATREPYSTLPPSAVILMDGPLLLGAGLPFDATVHLQLSQAALRRRAEPHLRWSLPAYERYAAEVAPASFADVVVRWDDLRHPAVVEDPS